MDPTTSIDSHIEGFPNTQTREEFSTYDTPLVRHAPMADSTFHFPIEC